VGFVLVLFVCVASLAVWRRSVGIGNARAIRSLDARRVQLEGERAAVQSQIREAASRGRIGALAEQRLGMRVPADTQVIIVSRPGAAAPAAPAPTP
jgi:membrane protein implicated in regulation of membrane protease activity